MTTQTDSPDIADTDTTSLSVVLPRFGGSEVLTLERRPIPQPVDDEVLVRVRAASVNPVDYKTRDGDFPPVGEDKLPMILGRDLAGTIEALGTRAHNMLSRGDRVMAHIDFDRGAQAEFVVVTANELVAMPASIDFAAAAGAGLASITAWQGLFDHGGLKAGERVLIHGAAGGVGHLAVQLAKAKGATVIATCSGDDVDWVRSLGADQVVDYKAERFEDVVEPVDMVFDLIGGETQERSWSVLRQGGAMISTLEQPDDAKADAKKARAATRYMAEPNGAQLGEIAAMMEAGSVRVEVARRFEIADVAAAYDHQERGHARGKVVLTLD